MASRVKVVGGTAEQEQAIKAFAAQVALHGVAGCVTSAVGGGQCGQGAISAALSKAMNFIPGLDKKPEVMTDGDKLFNLAVRAVSGGATSVLGGGKFANGAMTAGFSYLFNALSPGPKQYLNKPDSINNVEVCSSANVCVYVSSAVAPQVAAEMNRSVNPGTIGLNHDLEAGGNMLKAGVSLHPYGRVVVGAHDAVTVGEDLLSGRYKDAGIGSGGIAAGIAVEKLATRIGLPSEVAARIGVGVGLVYDWITGPFK